MNRTTFLAYCKNAPFGGRLSPQQVDGLNRIVDYWERVYSHKDSRWLAYILATVFHETGARMIPCKEGGGEKYLRSKPYYPYYGRGLVQITWKRNYDLYNIKDPEEALQWDKSLHILFDGMIKGRFTGKKLADYFADNVNDPRSARKIINGTDKAGLIADYYKNFLEAVRHANQPEAPPDVKEEDAQPTATPLLKDPQALAVGGAGVAGTVISAINSPWGVAGLVVLVIAIGVGAYFYFRNKEKYEKGL